MTISSAQLGYLLSGSTGGTHKRRGGRHRSDEALSFSDRDGCDSILGVTTSESLPTDLAAAHAMILAERAARLQA